MLVIRRPPRRGFVMKPFDPRDLFLGGKQGILLESWEPQTVYGTNGTTLISGYDQLVGKIADRSGSGNNATQADATKQFLYKLDANNRPCFYADGVNDLMVVANLSLFRNVPGATIIAVYLYRSFIVGSSKAVLTISTPNGNNRISLGTALGKIHCGGRRLDLDSYQQIVTNYDQPVDTILNHSARINFASATISQKINSSMVNAETTFQTAGNTSDTDSSFIGIGANSTGLAPANINLYALLVVPRALSDDEILNVENYFKQRLGL